MSGIGGFERSDPSLTEVPAPVTGPEGKVRLAPAAGWVWVAGLVWAFSLMAVASPGLAASAEAQASGSRPGPGRPKAGDAQARQVRILLQHIWWNQPDVTEALALEPGQRAQLDELLRRFLGERDQRRRQQREAFETFHRGLQDPTQETESDGDLRDALEGFAASVSAVAKAQMELKLEAVNLLTSEQRQRLAKEYPRLLRRSWIVRSAGGARPRRSAPAGDDAGGSDAAGAAVEKGI